jgi:cytidylate kinase
MIITICGPPGSGKDTVANLLIKKINERNEIENEGKNYELLSIGDLRRIAAQEKNLTIEEFNDWSLKNPKEGDEYFDEFQKNHAKKTSDFILVSRLGWFLISHSYKIYINVSDFEGAKRIFEQKIKDKNSRNEYVCKSIEEQQKINHERIESDKKRYKTLYNVNPYDKKNYDFIIDSTNKLPNAIVHEILENIKEKL